MILQYFLLLVTFPTFFCQDIVETSLGSVLGYAATSFNGRKFLAFEGIPYAKPPTGNLRFEEAEPADAWNNILNATSKTQCVQTVLPIAPTPDGVTQTEDCLYVNVYVPREKIIPEEHLDVVVYIHGGAFQYGSAFSNFKPDFIMDKEIIFVSLNYRLGIFGFLSTEDDVVPGNNGLKDQVLALKWVQQNVANFGGNPDSVTIYGLSAGSGSVHLHYFSELSKGLFHKGFSQSGVALDPWATVEESLNKARTLADSLECPTDTNENLVKCLKQLPADQIQDKMSLFTSYLILPADPFGPVVEKGGASPFLSENPYELLIKGQVMDLPFLTSNAIHDGSFPAQFMVDDLENVNQNWDELAPYIFDFNYTLDRTLWENASETIKQFYFGDQPVNSANFMKLVQACTDRWFIDDAETAIKLQAQVNESPVYYFLFAYLGDNNEAQIVGHGAEMKYFFGYVDPPAPLTENELKMKDVLLDMLVSYASTGVPTFNGVGWSATTYEEVKFVNVTGFKNEDIKEGTSEEFSNRSFWQTLQFAENDHL